MNILKKYTKSGVIITGSDNVKLDTPTFEIVNVITDTVEQQLTVEILHEVMQGSVKQPYSRFFNIAFSSMNSDDKAAVKAFLKVLQTKILELPQYVGSTEV